MRRERTSERRTSPISSLAGRVVEVNNEESGGSANNGVLGKNDKKTSAYSLRQGHCERS